MNDLLTTEELAARWRMEDAETVCAMIRRGELPASKIGKRYLIESTTVLQFEADRKGTTCRSINAVKSGGVAGATFAQAALEWWERHAHQRQTDNARSTDKSLARRHQLGRANVSQKSNWLWRCLGLRVLPARPVGRERRQHAALVGAR